MTVRSLRPLAAGVALVALAACGSDPTGPGTATGVSAQVNGVAWAATPILSTATFTAASNHLHISAISLDSYSLAITLVELSGPGTIALSSTFPLRLAVVTNLDGGSWGSSHAGGSGTVTISTLSQNRVVGTFTFTAPAAASSTESGTLTVTQGQFDLPLIRQ